MSTFWHMRKGKCHRENLRFTMKVADIKAYIHDTRERGLILGDKYITHDLVPSFYLAD